MLHIHKLSTIATVSYCSQKTGMIVSAQHLMNCLATCLPQMFSAILQSSKMLSTHLR